MRIVKTIDVLKATVSEIVALATLAVALIILLCQNGPIIYLRARRFCAGPSLF